MADMSKMMQQMQRMQQKFKEQQEEIANKTIVGEAGAGLVKIEMNGRHDAQKVSIDDSLTPGMTADDKEMLQDLICAAINNANQKIEANAKESMADLTSGLQLPPGLNNLFK